MSKFTTLEQHASYGIGLQMGQQLADRPFDGLDITAVAAGLAAAYNEEAPEVTEDQIRAAFTVISERMQTVEQEKAAALAEAGEVFLTENAKRAEVTTTASGLQYEVLVAAEGEKPTAASTVRTHYHGTLIDGTVFDSSYQRGEPAEFPVSGVIAGWTEALQMMAVGSKLRLYVPHNLAYGERGAGNAIAPFSTLIFDVELLAIV
ncbi:FKBP-type peptidyl-prolyl cis-trans isomerase [Alishewanella sp. 16-MA]|uniref:Peptidyl-prolyl cis-trans isomerase n=1 Tax=Alishewanella maricola TaxID=2795740 RepID=A0ABS8C361_9ALTE|nr:MULTISPECIES: FKBP-type peptidyl-prolyl cis-trans isomerase [Alishewanella]MDP4943978.1 FKBP-type peptidyl-prolyl cis-trans isomerase [Alishewanella sp.]MCB5226769.1 FKBP-type peptidyl-prolyl cis-trans isomerase [Alishewanella maricola]MDP5036072.1 FKBP-type peptidyl-prolyl cis-trans isomerase [Alishewanella sp.]MDP5185730.1 FKBP-type peptidyl-prolyl cis-trans isomerase [Alishewanella sp.]MDP5458106.1 FKBP-type peptidyl-prolyl cis-trans isomerase [Alishewanella sp. SMS8]